MKNKIFYFSALLMFFGLSACGQGPQPFKQGKDQCNHCRMTISDVRFAGQIVTNKGKIYKFDDVRCVNDFVKAGSVKKADVKTYYVADYFNTNNILPVDKAHFLSSPALRSPMNGNIAAFASRIDLDKANKEFKGEGIQWGEILE